MAPSPHEIWLDAQYNNRARIPGHAVLFDAWREASARARQRPCIQPQEPPLPVACCGLDWAYGPGADERVDVFFPATGPGLAPVLVFIHGGYWRSLDKADQSFVAPGLVAAGAVVVVPNYSLCPVVHIDDIAQQMVRLLAWVRAQAPGWGADPARLVLAGHSAGGQLVAWLMAQAAAAAVPPLAGGLAISGVFDLEPLRSAPFIRDDLRLDEAAVQRLSPVHWPAPAGPLWAVVGGDESEEFLRQNRLIQACWGTTAVPVCETLPGRHHLDVLHALAEPSGALHRWALGLLGLAPALDTGA